MFIQNAGTCAFFKRNSRQFKELCILIFPLIISLLIAGCGGGGGSSYAADTDMDTDARTVAPASARSVRLNNYGSFRLTSHADKDNKAKLEAALKVLAQRDNICIGESWQYINRTSGWTGLTPQTIKRLNPNAKVYEYWSLTSKPEWDTDWGAQNPETLKDWRMCSPLTWKQLEQNDWWLRDGNGNRVHEPGENKSWFLDVGKAGFKEAYLQGLLQRLSGKGYDGVMLDYWWPGIQRHIISPQGVPMPEAYPNDQVWFDKAWKPFVEYVTTGLHRAGYRIIGNCVGEFGTPNKQQAWQRTLVDGTNYEQFAFSFRPGNWLNGNVIEQRINAAMQDPLEVVITDSGIRSEDTEYARKHLVSLAMYYISLPSTQASRTYGNTFNELPHWQQIWNLDIGQPAQPAVKRSGYYFWSRKFSQGLVLLNYEAKEQITFALDQSYRDHSGKIVSGSIVVPAHTGFVLTKSL